MAKTAAKKKTAAEETPGDKIVRLRDEEEQSWADISEEMGIGQGRCMFLYMQANVKPSDRIKFDDDDDLAKQVVKLREKELLSWGMISARSGVGEAKLKRLFEEASGTPALGNRIGKGGRFPAGEGASENGGASTKKTSAKAKKVAEKEAAGKVKVDPKKPLVDMTLPELQARLNGKTIQVAREGGKNEKIAVKNIKSYKNGEVVLVDQKGGKSRTVLMAAIVKASK